MSISSYLCLPLLKKIQRNAISATQYKRSLSKPYVLNEMEERSHCIELFPFQQAAHAILPALAPAIPF